MMLLFHKKHNTMKRSLLFLGLSLALGFAITTSVRATGKFIKVCCDDNNGVCQEIGPTQIYYGPAVTNWMDCPL